MVRVIRVCPLCWDSMYRHAGVEIKDKAGESVGGKPAPERDSLLTVPFSGRLEICVQRRKRARVSGLTGAR